MKALENFQVVPVKLVSDTVHIFGWCHDETSSDAGEVSQCSTNVSGWIRGFLVRLSESGNTVLSLAPVVTNFQSRDYITGYIIILRDSYGTKISPVTTAF